MTVSSIGINPMDSIACETDSRDALSAAFDRCAVGIYRFVVYRVGDPHLADDMMQQAWLAAIQAEDRVPPAELEPWLRGVARNLIRNHWRTQSRRPDHLPIPDADFAAELSRRLVEEDIPDDALSRRETRSQLMLAITSLDAEAQEIVIARYFEGVTHAALASRLNVSERAIEGRLYRARLALRENLAHLDDEGLCER
ncbi:MAG TPA: sigma-70 family RNA polymerase sigma factor [Phycisphaerae bacterium]|nr:sigma-70 family RNA polymerase sigma factor [Phycisphaerae bacterium]HRW54398.1 sigma-70 family RNA polymerase sigma factor [Phycisphaerae bacterium]